MRTEKDNKIESLQALRCIAFLGVFLHHTWNETFTHAYTGMGGIYIPSPFGLCNDLQLL